MKSLLIAASALLVLFSTDSFAAKSKNQVSTNFNEQLNRRISNSNLSLSMTSGGVSGGGGNIIGPKQPHCPMDPETAEYVVKDSQQDLRNYIQQKREQFQVQQLTQNQMQAFAPIFTSDKDIEQVLNQVQVHVEDDDSCWDANRRPVDGSTISDRANSICISAYNIANKTDKHDVKPQSIALMLHEYSELVGLSEEQAVRVQTEALFELRNQ